MLLGCCAVQLLLGLMNMIHIDSTFTDIIFAALLIMVGAGMGSVYTLFPASIGETYGHVNFGACA